MYSEEDYNCPYCGWKMDYNDPKLKRKNWGFVCPDCDEYFETPDV